MDQQQTEQTDGGPEAAAPDAVRGNGAPPRAERLKMIALWCALLAVSAALLVGGLMIWRGLQADQAISLVARSTMGEMPVAGIAPAAVAPAIAAQVEQVAQVAQVEPVAPVAQVDAVPAAAQPVTVAPKARARVPLAKSGGKTAQQVKRSASVRAKALVRAKLKTEGRQSKRRPAAGIVQQRLARCNAMAGEAAAACYAHACRSYARKARVCRNDEPARRHR